MAALLTYDAALLATSAASRDVRQFLAPIAAMSLLLRSRADADAILAQAERSRPRSDPGQQLHRDGSRRQPEGTLGLEVTVVGMGNPSLSSGPSAASVGRAWQKLHERRGGHIPDQRKSHRIRWRSRF